METKIVVICLKKPKSGYWCIYNINSYSNRSATKAYMSLNFLDKLATESVGVEAG